MSYSLGVRLDGVPVSNDDAKILGLMVCGRSYRQITIITYLKPQLIYNIVSILYSVLETERCTHALTHKALLCGYDFDCHVNGIDVLNASERRRMRECVPRHSRAKVKIIISRGAENSP